MHTARIPIYGLTPFPDIEPVIRRFLSNMPQRFEVAKNDVRLHGALVEIDEATGKASKIQRVAKAI